MNGTKKSRVRQKIFFKIAIAFLAIIFIMMGLIIYVTYHLL